MVSKKNESDVSDSFCDFAWFDSCHTWI